MTDRCESRRRGTTEREPAALTNPPGLPCALETIIQSEILLELAEALLVRGGADPAAARLVAESLVGADLRSVDSHGVMRIPGYLEQIDDGTIQPRARPQIVRETSATVVVDGNRGFGQLAARTATLAALEKVREQGIVAATVAGVAHVGRLGEFAEHAAERSASDSCSSTADSPEVSSRPWRTLASSGHEPARLRHSGRDEAADRL